jgi:hypothetical protein
VLVRRGDWDGSIISQNIFLFENKIAQFHVLPDELQDLREGKKVLLLW